jgi:hypothetical protein
LSLYLNESFEHYREPKTGDGHSHFQFDGVSLENKYLVLNPADHAVGLALYLEPRVAGDEAELEEKVILGQRHGNWKWAFDLTHATEWANDFRGKAKLKPEQQAVVSNYIETVLPHPKSAAAEKALP